MNVPYLIYKITNTVNGKVYVGETSKPLKHRLRQHLDEKSNCVKLKRAIEKYGRESFIIEQVDHAHNKDEAFQKERFWIEHYDSVNCGYNILPSGYSCCGKEARKVYCVETKETFDSVGVCARVFNVSAGFVTNCCKGNRPTCKGKHLCFVGDNGVPNIENIRWTRPHHSKILCVETGIIYEDAKAAALSIGKSASAVNQCLYGKMKRCGGFHWEYVDKENFHKKENTQKIRFRKTMCVDTGEEFDTYTDAARSIGVTPSRVKRCCDGKTKMVNGYKFIFIGQGEQYNGFRNIL